MPLANISITVKQVNNMKLQNTVMQLRKVCSHPFLFEWPVDPNTFQPVINKELVNASGKMMVLERLLEELFRRKHKVLIFSQFTTMLDIIEASSCCKKNGSTALLNYFCRIGQLNSRNGLFVGSTALRNPWNGVKRCIDSKTEEMHRMLLNCSCSVLVLADWVLTLLQLTLLYSMTKIGYGFLFANRVVTQALTLMWTESSNGYSSSRSGSPHRPN
jgi:hypothetical protein